MSKVTAYFKDYPKSNQCFETSDGFLFHEENDAVNHGKTLERKLVKKHLRVASEQADELRETVPSNDGSEDVIAEKPKVDKPATKPTGEKAGAKGVAKPAQKKPETATKPTAKTDDIKGAEKANGPKESSEAEGEKSADKK